MRNTIFKGNKAVTISAPDGISAEYLMKAKIMEPDWLIPDWVPSGLCVLGAGPKSGKTIFAMQLAYSIATGTPFLEKDVTKGTVVYMDLESSPRRSRDRIVKMGMDIENVDNLIIVNEGINSLDDGFKEQLEAYKHTYQDLRLVVVDTWQKIAPERGLSYLKDSTMFHEMRELTTKLGITLMLIHHLSRAKHKDDPSQRLYGTNAMYANVDTLMLLTTDDRSSDVFDFTITGNDIEPVNEKLQLGLMHWSLLEDGSPNDSLMKRVRETPHYFCLKKMLEENGGKSVHFQPSEFARYAEKLGIGNLGGAKNVAGWFRSNASTLQEIMNVFICESRVAEGVRFSVLVRQDNVVLPVKKEPDKPEREQA